MAESKTQIWILATALFVAILLPGLSYSEVRPEEEAKTETSCNSILGRLSQLKVHLSDSEEATALYDEVMHLAKALDKDAMTLLKRKRQWTEIMESAPGFLRERTGIIVVFSDLDHFKKVNDELGHEEGDRVIERAASHFRKAFDAKLRGVDSMDLIRYGGDEFLAVIRVSINTKRKNKTVGHPILPENIAFRRMAERVAIDLVDAYRKSVEEDPNMKGSTASAGMVAAMIPENAKNHTDAQDFLKRALKKADNALYESKGVKGDPQHGNRASTYFMNERGETESLFQEKNMEGGL